MAVRRAIFARCFFKMMSHTTPVLLARRIANLTDARYFAAKEVQWLFFNLEAGTPGYLDPVYMQAMREWVEGPLIGAEFEHTPAAVINEAVAFYRLDGVAVPVTTDIDALNAAVILVKIALDHPDIAAVMAQYAEKVTAWIIELPAGTSSWMEAAETVQPMTELYQIALQYNASAEEVADVVSCVAPWGLGFAGGEEEAVGVKSFDELELIFDTLEGNI